MAYLMQAQKEGYVTMTWEVVAVETAPSSTCSSRYRLPTASPAPPSGRPGALAWPGDGPGHEGADHCVEAFVGGPLPTTTDGATFGLTNLAPARYTLLGEEDRLDAVAQAVTIRRQHGRGGAELHRSVVPLMDTVVVTTRARAHEPLAR
jgi:hypothetical protein